MCEIEDEFVYVTSEDDQNSPVGKYSAYNQPCSLQKEVQVRPSTRHNHLQSLILNPHD